MRTTSTERSRSESRPSKSESRPSKTESRLHSSASKRKRERQLLRHQESGSGYLQRLAELWDKEAQASRGAVLSEKLLFRCFFNLVYIGSVITLGLEAQLDVQQSTWDTCDIVFTSAFVCEAVTKIATQGPVRYFNSRLNVFELLVVMLTIVDAGLALDKGEDYSSPFRLVRALRAVRIFSMMPELSECFEDLIDAVRSVAWVLGLFLMLIFLGALVCYRLIGQSDAYPADLGFDPEDFFGTLGAAVFTLMNLAVLQEYETVMRALYSHQGYLLVGFMVYLAMTSFCITYAFIGVIVTRMTGAERAARDMAEQAEKRKRMQNVSLLMDVLYGADKNHDGTVSEVEAVAASKDSALLELMHLVDLPSGFTIQDMVTMLDMNGDGAVTQEEFKEGMRRLIYSTDFQRQCLLMMQGANLNKLVRTVHDTLTGEIKQGLAEIQKSVRSTVMEEVHASIGLGGSWHRLSHQDGSVNEDSLLSLDEVEGLDHDRQHRSSMKKQHEMFTHRTATESTAMTSKGELGTMSFEVGALLNSKPISPQFEGSATLQSTGSQEAQIRAESPNPAVTPQTGAMRRHTALTNGALPGEVRHVSLDRDAASAWQQPPQELYMVSEPVERVRWSLPETSSNSSPSPRSLRSSSKEAASNREVKVSASMPVSGWSFSRQKLAPNRKTNAVRDLDRSHEQEDEDHHEVAQHDSSRRPPMNHKVLRSIIRTSSGSLRNSKVLGPAAAPRSLL